MPDSRGLATAVAVATAHAQPSSVSFLRVVTEPGLGRLHHALAVTDLDGDGRDDIVAGGIDEYCLGATPADRFTKTPLHAFVSLGDGGFRHAPTLVEGDIEARCPIVVADDSNKDGRADLAVFDAGAYVDEHSLGYGMPPANVPAKPPGVARGRPQGTTWLSLRSRATDRPVVQKHDDLRTEQRTVVKGAADPAAWL